MVILKYRLHQVDEKIERDNKCKDIWPCIWQLQVQQVLLLNQRCLLQVETKWKENEINEWQVTSFKLKA